MKRFFGYPLRTLLIAVFIFISTFGLSANTIYPVIAATAEVGWHLEKINITDAWTITQGSPSITIAVLDCGINFTHPELSHAQWVNYDEIANNSIDDDGNGYIDDIYGWNFVGNDNDPNPTYTNIWRNNHGTFIAGVIAAKNDDIGIVGAAPNIKIMNLKIFYYYGPDDDEDEWVTRDELGLAIDYAVANGADIISCSFSYKKEVFENVKDVAFYDEMEAAIEQGVVIVASAGNYDSSTKRMPACFEFVIGVGATDINNNLASYSSYGDWVDLVAPGGDTDGNEVHKINSTYFDGSYTTGYGTSYSAPIVAGVIALMKSVDNSLNPNILRKILQQTCVDLGDKGKDKYFGYGLIDAAAAVTMAQNASTMNFVSGFTFILSSSSAIAVSVVILIWKRKCKLVN